MNPPLRMRRMIFMPINDNWIEKEGAGGDGGEGGSFDGLSSTVFTSTNAGIFTPTHSERSKHKARHNKHKQDKKRKKLLGKDKKNGVDRLVTFLQDGSPNLKIAKSPVSGMQGNDSADMEKGPPNKVMTGQGQGPSAAGNNVNNPVVLNWEKRQKGISKVEDHPTMGMNNVGDGKMMDASRHGVEASIENPANMNRPAPVAPQWHNKTYVQKASTEIPTIGIGTNQATDSHDIAKQPQATFTEKFSDKEKKDQVLKQNDFERKTKQHDNKEDDPGIEQPRAAGATAGMGNYPNSSMQMMEKTWGTGPAVDALRRDSGEQITAIPEDEDFAMREKLHKLHNDFMEKGDPHPFTSALMALDNDKSI